MYKIISSGSDGNAVLYFGNILVDIGVPFASLSGCIDNLSLVLLTHEHGDHLNIGTLKKLQSVRPGVRVGCGKFLVEKLRENGIRNIDVYKLGEGCCYGAKSGNLSVVPVKLYHDVPNFGYRLYKDVNEWHVRIFHATDTAHLFGITAKGYDLYAIEANYDEDRIYDIINEKQMRGDFAHQRGAMNSHLSIQQAQNFVLQNAGKNYEFIRLHQSKEF